MSASVEVALASTARAEASSSTIAIIASYAPSLLLFRKELLTELCARGYHVVAMAPPDTSVPERLRQLGVEFVPTPLGKASLNPFADLRYWYVLLRTLQSVRPVAVVSYTAKPVIWGSIAAACARVPRITAMITGLGFAFTEGASTQRRIVGAVMRKLYRLALSRCDSAIFQNPDDLAEFSAERIISGRKASVVNGSGVDTERFPVSPLPEQPVFLLIARLIADKGIREFAQAARMVRTEFPQARFRLIGWFDANPVALSREEVAQWEREGLLEYGGSVEDVRPEIAGCRYYVLPSFYREGTPRTILEAMAMGRPIITTDTPGCRETVIPDWNGLLVAPRDVAALSNAMKKLLSNPTLTAAMGANSRALAVRKYDARAVASDTADKLGLYPMSKRDHE